MGRGAPLGNRNAVKHGRYTAGMRRLRRAAWQRLLQARAVLERPT